MTPFPRPAAWAPLLLLALAGCAHRAPVVVEHPTWPTTGAAPLVRYLGGFPDERAVPAATGFWARAFEIVVGLDEEERDDRRRAILSRPFGVAVEGQWLYVADPDGPRVLRVDWAQGTFTAVECPQRPWRAPMAVALAPGGVLLVADAGAHEVVRVEGGQCTTLGTGLERPTGLAVSQDRLYVVDPPRHVVVGFALSGGAEVVRWGTRGAEESELNFPTAIAAKADGTLLVVDALNFRVVTFSREGKPLAFFGQAGRQEGDFGRPKAVAVDSLSRLWVSDAQYGVVLGFDATGAFQVAVGGSGREPRNLSLPAGLAIAGTVLFVADAYHHRVEFYELLEVKP